jgi:transcriptional antiterminator NusG
MYMQRRSEFHGAIPYLPIDRLLLKEGLSDHDARIAFLHLPFASRAVMADSENAGWFCLVVYPGDEKAVQKHLEMFDVENFVAKEPDHVCTRRGQKKVVEGGPVIPGYVLVRCGIDRRAFAGIRAVRGVEGILGSLFNPWRIKDKAMNEFMESVEDSKAEPQDEDILHVGDEVFVTRGPWVDFHGEVMQLMRKKAVIRMTLRGDVAKVTMPLAYFRKL